MGINIQSTVAKRININKVEPVLTGYLIAEDEAEAASIIQMIFNIILGVDLYPEGQQ